MDTDVLTSAFCRYARPEVPEDPRLGAGFSLPVVQAIVQAHGGAMAAENRALGGALFQFTLPLEENHHDDPGQDPDY